MNNTPLLQKTLAEDWNKLPLVIQRHYCILSDSNTCVKGNMEIGYPSYLLPLIYLIHLFGGLVFKRGNAIKTQVKKTVSENHTQLNWQRTLLYPDHKKTTLALIWFF